MEVLGFRVEHSMASWWSPEKNKTEVHSGVLVTTYSSYH